MRGETLGVRLGIAGFLVSILAGLSALAPFWPHYAPHLFAAALGLATLAAFLGNRFHAISTLLACLVLLAALPMLGGADASVFSARYPELWHIAAAVLMLAPVLGLFVHAFGDRTLIELTPSAITLLVVVLALGNLDLVAPVHVGALDGEGVAATMLPNPGDSAPVPGEWEARVTVTVHSKTEVAGLTLHHREVSEATVLARWSSTPDRAVFCVARGGSCTLAQRTIEDSIELKVEAIDGVGLFYTRVADHGEDGERGRPTITVARPN